MLIRSSIVMIILYEILELLLKSYSVFSTFVPLFMCNIYVPVLQCFYFDLNQPVNNGVVVVYPLPWPLLVEGVRSSRLWSTSYLLRPSDQQCCKPAGSVYKSRSDNVVRMWVQLKR